ncbi:MAG TPA: preprotein translocase subunit SecE [Bacteroidetes bacterium]|nr:MAG: preprotein translocase subunit SecE [Rhodothermaeota bacterium MED-G64]RPF80540.1 MAG: preprotein translocase subunit SecE [Rhodothermaceae bacterium TMED105]HBD42667.1 preprotein translocase subunit SecE [Bacteroidota bacterium]HBW00180.1 preprotein translocase subunit SecE [Bacteroidota bacterium]|tara:strand:+ start:209 stop:391 length:183 start_codon:yes stop_codon:yes gene_type:complete
MNKVQAFVEDVRREMGKVTWPTQKELVDQTIVVVVFSIILSLFIFGVDQLYTFILEAIYQ